jgi:hypothetical protein
MRSRFLVLSATVAALAGIVPAYSADMINDARLTVGITPEYELSLGSSETNGDSGIRIAGSYFRSIGELGDQGGWVWGVELGYNMATIDDVPTVGDVDMTSICLDLLGGYAYAMPNMKAVHFEATPFLGFIMTDAAPDSGSSEDGTGIEYGLRVAGFYTLANGFQAGIDLRYVANSVEIDTDVDADQAGLAAALALGYRF